MCYERYKGFTVCAHADPQSTPTEPKHCDEFAATGRCSEGKKYVLVAEETMPGLCGACWERTFKLEDAVGSLDDDDEDGSSSTWRLWRRIGWRHKEVAFVRDAMYLREMMYLDMFHHWKGPDHGREAIITHWTEVFREFTDWLGERLEKRDARGRLYFPPGEEKGVRIEKKKVLQHLVRWTCEFHLCLSLFTLLLSVSSFVRGLLRFFIFLPPSPP